MAKSRTKKTRKPFRQSLTKNGLLILAILLAGYIAVTLSLNLITRHGDEFTLPDLTGMSVAEAEVLAREADLRLVVSDSVYIKGMRRGDISRQNPAPGSKVKKNRRILLVINSVLPKQSKVPSLIGYSLRQARTEIASCGLRLGRLTYVEDIATNNVLEQNHNGRPIAPGTLIDSDAFIDLVLGLNPNNQDTYIPSVRGYRYRVAADILHDNSLNIHRSVFDRSVKDYSDSLDAFVYDQFPPASDSLSVRIGTSVTLYLSRDTSRLHITAVPDEDGKR